MHIQFGTAQPHSVQFGETEQRKRKNEIRKKKLNKLGRQEAQIPANVKHIQPPPATVPQFELPPNTTAPNFASNTWSA